MNLALRVFSSAISIAAALICVTSATAASGDSLEQNARAALQSLYAQTPSARALGAKATGILVFPRIVKAGLIVGGQGGDGVMLKNNKNAGYYHSGGLSVGYQAGAQSYGYALFFMSDSALQYLSNSDGWEIGVGPSVVVVDSGMARSMTTTTAKSDIYAFFFNQQGLMAGMGLQGAKITARER